VNKTIKAPRTVREAGDMAHALGMTLPEFLDVLGPIPMPPAGFTLAQGSDHRWIGQEIVKRRWIILPVWDGSANRRSFELWMADHRPPRYGSLTAAEALELSADLAAAAGGAE
jgi:hypothetical protein